MELNDFTASDLITQGTFLWEDTPEKTIWISRDGDKMHITTQWKSAAALLAENAAAANSFSKTGKLHELERVASIPMGIYQELQDKGVVDDDVAMARFLNDGDFSKFRVNSLRV